MVLAVRLEPAGEILRGAQAAQRPPEQVDRPRAERQDGESGRGPAPAARRFHGAEDQRRGKDHAAARAQQRRGAVDGRAQARAPQQTLQVPVDQVACGRVAHGLLVQGRVSAYIRTLTAMRAAASRTGAGSPWTSGSSSPSPMSLDQV